MLNFIPNGVSFVGIGLLVAGVMLFLLRQYRPSLARDHDIFFAAISLVSGLIFIVYGWKFDPLMQFGTVMLTASSIFFAVESIRLRGIATAQAKQAGGEPIIDDDRPVSRGYRAELDEYDEYDYDGRNSRRMRGSRDSWDDRDRAPRRLDAYVDDRDERYYYDEPRREPVGRLRPSDRDRPDAPPERSRRPARSAPSRSTARLDQAPSRDYYDDEPPAPRRRYDAPRDPYDEPRDRPSPERPLPERPLPERAYAPPAGRDRRAIRPSRPEPPSREAPTRERRWDSIEDEPPAPYRRPQDGIAANPAPADDVRDVDYRPVNDANPEFDRPPLDL